MTSLTSDITVGGIVNFYPFISSIPNIAKSVDDVPLFLCYTHLPCGSGMGKRNARSQSDNNRTADTDMNY